MAKKEKNTNQKNRYLTINFNNEFVKVCEVSKTNKGLVVHKVFTIPTPARAYRDGVIRDRNAIAKELTIVLQRHGITTTNVIFTISSTKIATKEVIIPYVNKKKMASIIQMNATEYFPVNIDEYIIESSILEVIENPDNKKDKKLKLMVAAVPSKMIEEYYDFASTMGFKIVAIDYLGNSTLQLLKTQSDVESSVMVQIENDSTIISVFNKDVLQLQRTVPYGKTMIVNAVMERRKIFNYDVALDILQKEQLIHPEFDGDEITESLRYLVSNVSRIMDYQVSRNSNKPIDKAYIVGNATYILGLEELFRNSLSAPVESISFLKGVTADKKTYVEETTLTTFIANIGAVINPINFVPKTAETEKKGNIDFDQMKLVLGVAIAGAALLIIIPYVQMNMAKREMEAAKKRLDGIKSIEQVMDAYYQAKAQYDDVNEFRLISSNHNDVLCQFIADMETVMPQGVRITDMEIEDGVVEINGEGFNKYSVAKFIQQMKSISNSYAVFDETIEESIDDNLNLVAEFTFTCAFFNKDVVIAEEE
ncbi:MAG: pilus assembly protein PilM [Lachnospiraceae bacterium]